MREEKKSHVSFSTILLTKTSSFFSSQPETCPSLSVSIILATQMQQGGKKGSHVLLNIMIQECGHLECTSIGTPKAPWINGKSEVAYIILDLDKSVIG